jgi:hypothetical protein
MAHPRATAHALLATSCLANHGESVTYLSKNGGPRTLTAAVDEGGTFEVSAQGRDTEEVIRVLVMRDKDHTLYGGIDSPQIGDALTLDRDPDGKAFTWNGHRQDVTQFSWVLLFHRKTPYSRGGGR